MKDFILSILIVAFMFFIGKKIGKHGIKGAIDDFRKSFFE